jgi:hypothetical protein
MFKSSKILNKEGPPGMAFRGGGDMPKEDLDLLFRDKSGMGAIPFIEIAEEKRIWKNAHDLAAVYLAAGRPASLLMMKFMKEFVCQLDLNAKDQTVLCHCMISSKIRYSLLRSRLFWVRKF